MALSSSSRLINTALNINQPAALVEETWLETLREIITTNYAKTRANRWDELEYPKAALKHAYIGGDYKDPDNIKYNPFNLTLPYELQGYELLYDLTKIYRPWSDASESYYTPPGYVELSKTGPDYFDFLKLINFAYIDLLSALNGSAQAIAKVKILFSEQSPLFKEGLLKWECVAKNIKKDKKGFVLALLAYFTLDIIYSQEHAITTAARVEAMKLIKTHFNIQEIATAFRNFSLGFWKSDVNKLNHLIPLTFLRHYNNQESQGNLFHKHPIIRNIFEYQYHSNKLIVNSNTVSQLLSVYPAEAAQVLHSLIKFSPYTHTASYDWTFVFTIIMEIASLTTQQQEVILGPQASYRNTTTDRIDMTDQKLNVSDGLPRLRLTADNKDDTDGKVALAATTTQSNPAFPDGLTPKETIQLAMQYLNSSMQDYLRKFEGKSELLEMYESVKDKLTEDEADFFEDCMCPVSLCVMNIPVTLFGNEYDLISLLNVKDRLNEATNKLEKIEPINNKYPFTFDQISPSFKTEDKIRKKLTKIIAKLEITSSPRPG
jgi:hypothetical protein